MAIRHLEKLESSAYLGEYRLPCVVREMRAAPSNAYVALHGHGFSELVIVCSGSLNHIHTKGVERISAGDFFVIHPSERHGFAEFANGTAVFNLIYKNTDPPPSLLFGACPLAPVFFPNANDHVYAFPLGRIPRRSLQQLVGLIKSLRREARSRHQLRGAICSSLFGTIVLYLARYMKEGAPRPSNALRAELDFIRGSLGGKITLRDICAASGRPLRAVYDEFKTVFGQTPGDYILGLRTARAESLLGQKGMTLSEVAERTGFCNASHLARTLHRRRGGQ